MPRDDVINEIGFFLATLCISMGSAAIMVGLHEYVSPHESQPCEQQVEEGEPDA